MLRRILLLTGLLCAFTASSQATYTLRGQMRRMEELFDVHFVYESRLPVDLPAHVLVNPKLSLRQNLTAIFRGTGIDWTLKRNYVILSAAKSAELDPDEFARLKLEELGIPLPVETLAEKAESGK